VVTVRIVCVGLATVDLVQRVARIPRVDEKAEAQSVEIAAGGPATNAAVTAAALGADVVLVTAVGAHPLGGLVRADLETYRVALVDAAPHATQPPALSAVTVQAGTGQRTIVSRNAGDIPVGVPPVFARVVAEADVVLVDGHHPALALAAARSGRPLIVDAGTWRPAFAQVLPHATVVACSSAFRLPGANSQAAMAAGLRRAGVRRVAVTHGPEPVRWWSENESGRIPVPPAPAVDTAGAGDAFHGALAVAVARDPRVADLPGALRYAIGVAGVRVRHAGPRAWLGDPDLARLKP
jgi:sugar/nucleoside kinase (ribokinase family)